jgi:cbb3-type cytochrome oxidase subunit 1
LVVLSLPLMLLALAIDAETLFLIAGPVQAAAIAVFLVNIVPLAWHLHGPVRAGILIAVAFLVFGVGLGVAFAIDASLGPRLRQAHATANVFGFAGLLISGFGYSFVPHFAGRRLKWPRLAPLQLGMLLAGVVAGIIATVWRGIGDGPDEAVMLAQVVVGLGLVLFAVQAAGTFAGRPPEQIVLIRPTVGGAVPHRTATSSS